MSTPSNLYRKQSTYQRDLACQNTFTQNLKQRMDAISEIPQNGNPIAETQLSHKLIKTPMQSLSRNWLSDGNECYSQKNLITKTKTITKPAYQLHEDTRVNAPPFLDPSHLWNLLACALRRSKKSVSPRLASQEVPSQFGCQGLSRVKRLAHKVSSAKEVQPRNRQEVAVQALS
jgi:hypothetical protein